MSKVTFSAFDASKYLDSQEAMNDYLAIALEDGDTKTVQVVLRDIARAHGMTQLAKETELNRESLYKSLSKDGNPSFAAITRIMKALGLRMTLAEQKNLDLCEEYVAIAPCLQMHCRTGVRETLARKLGE